MTKLRRRPGAWMLWLVAFSLAVTACSSTDSALPPAQTTSNDTAAPQSTAEATDAQTTGSETLQPTSDVSRPPIVPLSGRFVPAIVATFPHDPTSYTQGLELLDGLLLESTGLRGESERRLVQIETGETLVSDQLGANEFGEGLTIAGDELIQITWQEETYFRADPTTLRVTSSGRYQGEGWGICFDGTNLVMSNGSDTLTLRDPATFEPVRTVSVSRADGSPVDKLNELECVGNQVFANIYTQDEIVVINSITGAVEASIDASSLRPVNAPLDDADYALNGIAYNDATGTFYVTGKWWPVLYEVAFVPS